MVLSSLPKTTRCPSASPRPERRGASRGRDTCKEDERRTVADRVGGTASIGRLCEGREFFLPVCTQVKSYDEITTGSSFQTNLYTRLVASACLRRPPAAGRIFRERRAHVAFPQPSPSSPLHPPQLAADHEPVFFLWRVYPSAPLQVCGLHSVFGDGNRVPSHPAAVAPADGDLDVNLGWRSQGGRDGHHGCRQGKRRCRDLPLGRAGRGRSGLGAVQGECNDGGRKSKAHHELPFPVSSTIVG